MNDPAAGTTAQPNLSAHNPRGNDRRPSDTQSKGGQGAPDNAAAEAKAGAPETAQAPPAGSPGADEASGKEPRRRADTVPATGTYAAEDTP